MNLLHTATRKKEKVTNHRLMELVLIIAKAFSAEEHLDMKEMERSLVGKGYSNNEIDSAVSWFTRNLTDDFDKKGKEEKEEEAFTSGETFRVQGDIERKLLTSDAFGFLLNLRSLGLVNDMMYEGLLNHLLILGLDRVDRDVIEDIVLSDMFGDDGEDDDSVFDLDDDPEAGGHGNRGTVH